MMVFATSINKPVEAPGKPASAGAFLSLCSHFFISRGNAVDG